MVNTEISSRDMPVGFVSPCLSKPCGQVVFYVNLGTLFKCFLQLERTHPWASASAQRILRLLLWWQQIDKVIDRSIDRLINNLIDTLIDRLID
jgi:hypothetical protein